MNPWLALALQATVVVGVGAFILRMFYKSYKDTCENERAVEAYEKDKHERS